MLLAGLSRHRTAPACAAAPWHKLGHGGTARQSLENGAPSAAVPPAATGWDALPEHLVEEVFLRLKNAPRLHPDSKVR